LFWLRIGWCRTKYGTPFCSSRFSCGLGVSTARWKSGPDIVLPGGRAIFLMFAMTSLASPAFLSTSIIVVRSVKASTPLRR